MRPASGRRAALSLSLTLLPRTPTTPTALTRALRALAALGAASLALVASPARADDDRRAPPATAAASFALIGDVPYGTSEESKFERVIDAINASHAAGGVRLVVHTGDVKRGRERCDDALLQRRFDLFQRLEPPFVITPGDNDWTDCHRKPSGNYLPTERLARFRQIFYPRPGFSTGRQPMPVHTQAAGVAADPAQREHVENQIWAFAGVTMATVHVVGSGNGLEPWDGIDRRDHEDRPRRDRLAEFTRREAAALAWIDAAFEHAREHRSAGVVIAMQANPRLHRAATDSARRGFNRLLERLARRASEFGKPVLLAHGDSHTYRFDQPLPDARADSGLPALPNLRRVENFGSPQVHWVEVRVDAGSPEVFTAVPHYVLANLLPF
jgi:hypothetical protein